MCRPSFATPRLRAILLAFLSILCLSVPASASVFRVTNNLDDGSAGSLRVQLAAAQAAQTSGGVTNIVDVEHVIGPIILTQGELSITKDVTIDGPQPSVLSALAISGNGGIGRVFNITAASGTISVTLYGLSIANGGATGANSPGLGGNILASGVNLRLANCAVNNGNAQQGGGVYLTNNSTLTTINTTFDGNTAQSLPGNVAQGGAICAVSGTSVTVNGGSFINNGAVGADSFAGSGAGSGLGGAVFGAASVPMTFTLCQFIQNASRGGVGEPGIAGTPASGGGFGSGGPGSAGTAGGEGLGGAVYSDSGSSFSFLGVQAVRGAKGQAVKRRASVNPHILILSQVNFVACFLNLNSVSGGTGGAGGVGGDGFAGGGGGAGGAGGAARGGAIYVTGGGGLGIGTETAGSLTLDHTIITNGTVQAGLGGAGGAGATGIITGAGGIGGVGGEAGGGGLFVVNTAATVQSCTIGFTPLFGGQSGNNLRGGSGGEGGSGASPSTGGVGGAGEGAGIFCDSGSSLAMTASTVTQNDGQGGTGGAGAVGGVGEGGGLYAAASASIFSTGANLTLVNCTVYANDAAGGGVGSAAGAGDGGGLYGEGDTSGLGSSASIQLTSCTVNANVVSGGVGGGIGSGNSVTHITAVVKSSIIAGNFAATDTDVNGAYTSQGSNVIGVVGGSTGFTDGTNHDQVGTMVAQKSAGVLTLADNGGPTQTQALSAASADIGADFNNATPTDQRGAARPAATPAPGTPTPADIGAFQHATTDTSAPTTVPSTVPVVADGDNGYFRGGNVQVTLTATDPDNTLANITTFFTTDNTTPSALTSPVYDGTFPVTADGTQTITFFSQDTVPNAETIPAPLVLNLDATPPVTTVQPSSPVPPSGYYTGSVVVTLSPTDNFSGVADTFYVLDGTLTTTASPGGGVSTTVTGDGTHILVSYSVDNAGNIENETTTVIKIDSQAPVTTAILNPATPNGNNGYYKSPVTVTLTATDSGGSGTTPASASVVRRASVRQTAHIVPPTSPVGTFYTTDGTTPDASSTHYTGPFLVSSDGTHTVKFFSMDNAGNTETPAKSVTFKIDATLPSLTFGAATPAANGNGYTNAPVDIPYTTSDGPLGSGIATALPASALNFSAEGTGQTQTVTVTDNAGNVQTFTTPAVNIDLTKPQTTAQTASTTSGEKVTLTATDALSGVASTVYTVDGGTQKTYTVPFIVKGNGLHTVVFHSTDNAGNVESPQTSTFTVNIAAPVTTATITGPQGTGGAFTGTVTVTLTSTSGTSTVTGTFFTLDGGAQQTYTGPFSVTGTGTHTLSFFSTDAAGNTEAPNVRTITIAPAHPPILHTYSAGLQMIGVPENYNGVALALTLSDTSHKRVTWNPQTLQYDFRTDLTPGVGYWVRFSQRTDLYDTGVPTPTKTPFSIALKPGWNEIGNPYRTSVSLPGITVTDVINTQGTFTQAVTGGVVYGTLYTYPAGAGAYQSVSQSASLNPYQGYWIYAYRACTLRLPAP